MISKERIDAVKSGLKVGRTIGLVWSSTGNLTILVVFMIFLETVLFFGSLYALKVLIDIIASRGTLGVEVGAMTMHQVLIAGGLAIAYNMVKAISVYCTEVQAARVSEQINDKIHEKAADLELAFYENPTYFDTLQRAREAGSERPSTVITALLETFKSCLSMLAVASIIFSIDWILLPILVLFILPTLFIRIYFSEKQNKLRICNTPLERKTGYLSDLMTTVGPAKELRSYHLGNYFKKQYKTIRLKLMTERLKISLQRTNGEVLTTALASFGFFACIFYIAMEAAKGRVTAGDITIFLVVFPQVFNLLQGVTAGITVIYQNNIFVNSIFDLLDLKSTFIQTTCSQPIPQEKGMRIEFRDVCFSYPDTDDIVLKDINLTIPEGKIIGLVGMNGAGKTTLIKLISRLYDPNAGQILFGGVDIRHLDLKAYRKEVATVFQDFVRYSVTAAENISLGDIDREEHDEEDIRLAAKLAGAHAFIDEFENGYETMMGRIFENGKEISVGQWQKLATARALYHPGRFLILDEATSALDANAVHSLFGSLKQYIGDRGALVISHRYSTIKNTDYVYVLSNGKISEHGTPDFLTSLNGDYAKLFKDEFSDDKKAMCSRAEQ